MARKTYLFLQSNDVVDRINSSFDMPSYFSGAVYKRCAEIWNSELSVFVPDPKVKGVASLLYENIRSFNRVIASNNRKDDNIFVVWQGYGMYTALVAGIFKRIKYVFNTYKMPWPSNQRISANINDFALLDVLTKAKAVITISSIQKDILIKYNPNSFWIPFASDIDWWTPDVPNYTCMKNQGINLENYILIMGDVDREEETTAKALKRLPYPILRVTRDPKTAKKANYIWSSMGVKNWNILVNVSFKLLREIYRGARVVIVPARSRVHPAGMTSMSEAMSCGRPVVIPKGLATEGYVENNKDAFVIEDWSEDNILNQVVSVYETNKGELIGAYARKTCEEKFNIDSSARILAGFVKTILDK